VNIFAPGTDPISLVGIHLVLVGTTPFKKPRLRLCRFKSNPGEIFLSELFFIQENMHRSTESDFVIWRHTFKMADMAGRGRGRTLR